MLASTASPPSPDAHEVLSRDRGVMGRCFSSPIRGLNRSWPALPSTTPPTFDASGKTRGVFVCTQLEIGVYHVAASLLNARFPPHF
jgi:hypothetical protein